MSEIKMLHFIHIPRTGGTSFKYAMKKGYFDDGYALDNIIKTDKYNIILNGHGQSITLNSIFFIRDPIERFTSCFYSRYNQGGDLYSGPWLDEEVKSFRLFKLPNLLGEALSSGNIRERIDAEFAMNNIQHIRRNLGHWLGTPEFLKNYLKNIFFVGRTKTLYKDFEILKSKLGLGDGYQLPDDPVKQSKITLSSRELSDKAISNLKYWYKDDYKLINILENYFDIKV